MTDTPTDPNEVRMTGENSFIRLSAGSGVEETTRASHWRVLLSPGGSGHALLLKSEVTGGAVRVYSDNIAMTRWLQEEIESMLFPEFADTGLPVIDAVFSKFGDTSTFWTESVESAEDSILLTWYDFMHPFVNTAPPGTMGRPLGVFSTFIPARRAQLTYNGTAAAGLPVHQRRGHWDATSACLALSETWVRPKS